MKILYANACVRKESRTDRIARALIEKRFAGCETEEVLLVNENLKPLDANMLSERDKIIADESWDNPLCRYAVQFAAADAIVISAPYWDGSFPSLLKLYIENIYITGIVSRYGPDGRPVGMCNAKKLYYVTTAGGPYNPAFSFDHISDLATTCFGIPETELIKAEMLDVFGFDAEAIVNEVISQL